MEARVEWLEGRKKGIGGSDAAAVCGLSPWKTAHELYLEKRSEIDDAFGDTPPEHVRFGNLLEDVIAEEYMHRTGKTVRRANLQKAHPKHDWMLANIDRKIEGENAGLECKNSGDFAHRGGDWGEEGTDQLPEHYLMQTQHYLGVTGWDYFDLAVLVGGNRLKVYTVERDEELIAEMIGLEGDFWEAVLSGNAPAVDFNHDSTIDMLKRKYKGTNGIITDLPNSAAILHDEKKAIAKQIRELTADGKVITAELLEMVGQNAAGRFMNAEGGYRRKLMEAKDVAFTKKEYFDFRWVKNI